MKLQKITLNKKTPPLRLNNLGPSFNSRTSSLHLENLSAILSSSKNLYKIYVLLAQRPEQKTVNFQRDGSNPSQDLLWKVAGNGERPELEPRCVAKALWEIIPTHFPPMYKKIAVEVTEAIANRLSSGALPLLYSNYLKDKIMNTTRETIADINATMAISSNSRKIGLHPMSAGAAPAIATN